MPLPSVDRGLACREVMAPESWDALVARFGAARVLEVTEDEIRSYATNGLPIGRDLLAPSLVPERVVELVTGAGMRVVPLTMLELCEKAGGASRCLVSIASVPPGLAHIPDDTKLASVRARIEQEDR